LGFRGGASEITLIRAHQGAMNATSASLEKLRFVRVEGGGWRVEGGGLRVESAPGGDERDEPLLPSPEYLGIKVRRSEVDDLRQFL
jgi:hypothetical protein